MAVTRLNLVFWAGTDKSHPDTWVDWDPEAGTLSGPAADEIRLIIKGCRGNDNRTSGAYIDPDIDAQYQLGKEPLKSYSDMAALVYDGGWQVPDILKPHFPEPSEAKRAEHKALAADPNINI